MCPQDTAVKAAAAFSVPVEALLATPGVTPAVAKRIVDADADRSGMLSLGELVRVFQHERRAAAERRLLAK